MDRTVRIDPLINLAHDYQEAAAALQRELRRLGDLDAIPDQARKGMAELMRRGAHTGVSIAHVLQPR